MKIQTYLKTNRLLMDGAMGTYFLSRQAETEQMPERALLTNREEIKQIHKAYCGAGANLLRTDTFAANIFSLGTDGEGADRIIRLAVQTAKEAIGDRRCVFLAGAIGPVPENALITEEEILNEYKRMCRAFLKEGVDAILFETFSRLDHIEVMAEWLRNEAPDCFVMVQFALNKSGYTMDGISAERILNVIAKQDAADVVGFNCGIGSGHMEAIVKRLDLTLLTKTNRTQYLSIAPNAAYPQQKYNRMHFRDNAEYFAAHMKEIAGLGTDILGSCCGTTPEYTRRMKQEIAWDGIMEVRQNMKRKKQAGTVYPVQEPVCRQEEATPFLESLKKGKKVLAVELDPPYDASCERVLQCGSILKKCGIDVITMADSPMGRSRVDSILMSVRMASETGMEVMPHVCCRDKNMIAMRSGLMGAYVNGIRNFLIVTGDPVPGTERNTITSVFDYNSIRLMQRVKEMNVEHFQNDPVFYGGALNYRRGSLDSIAARMEQKISAGASYFLTQPVFSDDDMERIAWLKQRIDTKILCGIMPLVSYKNAKFIQNEITGVYVPEEIVNRYHPDMTRAEGEAQAVLLAKELTQKMDKLADGFYFMLPFNRVSVIEQYMAGNGAEK